MADEARDEAREDRIIYEIVVDAYGEEERAIGWHCYLGDHLAFPFLARCVTERRISPLHIGEVVEVTGMASEEDCKHEMFVEVRWKGRTFGVPLSQLEGISVDAETQEATDDWRYWIARGYQM